MIVPSMTVSEVLTELLRDFETVRRKSKIEGQLLMKEMLRKGLSQQTVAACFRTSRRNDWNMIHLVSPAGVKTHFYVKANDKESIAVYSLMFLHQDAVGEKIFLMKYYKHFFDRYNQRMGLGFTEMSKTIKHFFKRNSEFTLGNTPELENGISSATFIYEEGMEISWLDEPQSTFHTKTFISKEMYTTGQEQLAYHLQHMPHEEFPQVIKLEHLRKVS